MLLTKMATIVVEYWLKSWARTDSQGSTIGRVQVSFLTWLKKWKFQKQKQKTKISGLSIPTHLCFLRKTNCFGWRHKCPSPSSNTSVSLTPMSAAAMRYERNKKGLIIFRQQRRKIYLRFAHFGLDHIRLDPCLVRKCIETIETCDYS